MVCKQLSRLPVLTEWAQEVCCPACRHYRLGRCGNPSRARDRDPCPLDAAPPSGFGRPAEKAGWTPAGTLA